MSPLTEPLSALSPPDYIATRRFSLLPGSTLQIPCTINGVDTDDTAIATLNGNAGGLNNCFGVIYAIAGDGDVTVKFRNFCSVTANIGPADPIGIIVYDK